MLTNEALNSIQRLELTREAQDRILETILDAGLTFSEVYTVFERIRDILSKAHARLEVPDELRVCIRPEKKAGN